MRRFIETNEDQWNNIFMKMLYNGYWCDQWRPMPKYILKMFIQCLLMRPMKTNEIIYFKNVYTMVIDATNEDQWNNIF